MSSRQISTSSPHSRGIEAIVVGASAGAFEALSGLLDKLPKSYQLPILVVVHLSADRNSAMADVVRAKCQLRVKEAEDKEPIEAGTVYFAPPDYHLLVEQDKRVSLSSEEPVLYSRPSIDVLFESAADVYGSALIGVVLTGANSDGTEGLKSIVAAGGIGLVQSPALAQAKMMPQSALDGCPQAHSLSIPEISTYLREVNKAT